MDWLEEHEKWLAEKPHHCKALLYIADCYFDGNDLILDIPGCKYTVYFCPFCGKSANDIKKNIAP